MASDSIQVTLPQANALRKFLGSRLNSVDEIATEIGRQDAFRIFTLYDRLAGMIDKMEPKFEIQDDRDDNGEG